MNKLNTFQIALLSRENQIKTMFNNLQHQLDTLKHNELKWTSIFFEFYSNNEYLTEAQRDVLEQIYNHTMNLKTDFKAS